MCSSTFISPIWTTTLYGYGPKANSILQLDRPFLSKQYQLIGSICNASKSTVDHALLKFNMTTLVSTLLLSRDVFESQANVIIKQLIKQTPLDFQRLLVVPPLLLEANLIPSVFGTDWSIEYGNASNDYLFRNIPRLYANGTCNCAVSADCHEPLIIGPPF